MPPDLKHCGCSPAARRDAFTLIEMVVAVAVLMICVTGAVALTKWVVRCTDFNRKVTTATFLAQDKMECLMQLGYTAISSGSDSTQNVTRTWTVSAGTGYKEIVVTSSWNGMDGASRTVSVKSMLAEP